MLQEFERYHSVKFVITDPTIAKLALFGTVTTASLDDFAGALFVPRTRAALALRRSEADYAGAGISERRFWAVPAVPMRVRVT